MPLSAYIPNRDRRPKNLRFNPRVLSGIMIFFVSVLAILGWFLIRQDADLDQQRRRAQLEADVSNTANRLETFYQARLVELRALHDIGFGPATGLGSTFMVSDSDITAESDSLLLYWPVAEDRPVDARLILSDRLEFRDQDFPSAISILEQLTSSSDLEVKAGALLRLARIADKTGDTEHANQHFTQLAALKKTSVGSIPASWLGLSGKCAIAQQSSQQDLRECVANLRIALLSPGERARKTSFVFYAQQVAEWEDQLGLMIDPIPTEHGLSNAVIRLAEIHGDVISGTETGEGFRTEHVLGKVYLIFWSVRNQVLIGSVILAESSLQPWVNQGTETASVSLSDDGGNYWNPSAETDRIEASRAVSIAGKRIVIRATETDQLIELSAKQSSRGVLLVVLVLVIVIASSSGYLLSRAVKKELELAQVQSDFVSAVSHEFRTPLTSMRQLTEMLVHGRVSSEKKAASYYQLLDKEVVRLTRLVESLLNFGRMEMGAFSYNKERLALDELVSRTVHEFEHETGRQISVEQLSSVHCQIDGDMVFLALWNLLDNAAKYSAEEAPISVTLTEKDGFATLSVVDSGSGIPDDEKEKVFDKFVRSPSVIERTIKGTGLGLTLVKSIVEAHEGSVSLQSAEGEGSTFSIKLPVDDV